MLTFSMEQFPDLNPEQAEPKPLLKFQPTPTYGYHGMPVDPKDALEPDVVYGYDHNFNIVMTTITKIKKAVSVSHNPETFLFPHSGCVICGRWFAETNGSGDCWYPTLKKALHARALEMLEAGFELTTIEEETHPVLQKLKDVIDSFDSEPPNKFPRGYLGLDTARVVLETGKPTADYVVAILNTESCHRFTHAFSKYFKILHKGFGEVNHFIRLQIKLKDQGDLI